MKSCSVIISHYSLIDDFEDKGRFKLEERMMRSGLLRQTMESLKENTDYPAEIIVIDNGGNPDDSEYLLKLTREGLVNTLIRNKDNMGFGFAWNQGARLATGDYLCFTCNDIKFEKGWLESCISNIEKYPERKFLATPFIENSKYSQRFIKEILDGNRVTTLAGSNCCIMKRETYLDIGEFPHHRVGGSIWFRRMNRMGYMVIATPKNLVSHIGYKYGINFTKQFYVNKYLLKKEEINFNYKYDNAHKDYYWGYQREAGCPHKYGYESIRESIKKN